MSVDSKLAKKCGSCRNWIRDNELAGSDCDDNLQYPCSAGHGYMTESSSCNQDFSPYAPERKEEKDEEPKKN